MLTHHPANLLLRLVIQIVSLVSLGQWGWDQGAGWMKYALGIGIPVLAALIWIVFTVPGDPGWKNRVVIPIPGRLRLGLEILLFLIVLTTLVSRSQVFLAGFLAFALLLHYLWSAERVAWLGRNRRPEEIKN